MWWLCSMPTLPLPQQPKITLPPHGAYITGGIRLYPYLYPYDILTPYLHIRIFMPPAVYITTYLGPYALVSIQRGYTRKRMQGNTHLSNEITHPISIYLYLIKNGMPKQHPKCILFYKFGNMVKKCNILKSFFLKIFCYR